METFDSIWRAASYVLEHTRSWSNRKVLTEFEYVDAAVMFANTGDWKAAIALLGGVDPPASALLDPTTEPLFRRVGRRKYQDERAEFRTYVRSVVGQRRKPSDSLNMDDLGVHGRAYLAAHSGRIIQIPVPSLHDEGSSTGFRYLPQNIVAALAYVLLLLLDPERPYYRRICCCRLEECGEIFWAKTSQGERGRVRSRYCSDEHMLIEHDRGASRRVIEARARSKSSGRKSK